MKIPKHVFPIVECASRDEGRYATRGVFITPHRPLGESPSSAHAVATDGRQFLALQFPIEGDPTTDDIIVDVGQWKDAAKMVAKEKLKDRQSAEFAYSVADRMVHLTSTDAKLSRKAVEGIYPKYPHVVPKYENPPAVFVNPRLLGELLLTVAKILDQRGGADDCSVRIALDPAGKGPLLITARDIAAVCAPNNLNENSTAAAYEPFIHRSELPKPKEESPKPTKPKKQKDHRSPANMQAQLMKSFNINNREAKVLSCMAATGPADLAWMLGFLESRDGMREAEVLSTLVVLEVKRLIRQLPGKRYEMIPTWTFDVTVDATAPIPAPSAAPASNVVSADFTPPSSAVITQEEIDKLLAEAAALLATM